MMKKMNLMIKAKKNLKFLLYLFSFFIFFFITYISLPKLLNFSLDSIKKNLKINNNININSISKVDYKIFPTPRLIILNSNFTIGKSIVELNNVELEIILSISKILSFKEVNYKKLLISKGSLKIKLNNINQLLTITDKHKKKLIFKKNNLILLQEEKVFLEINDTLIKIVNLGESFFLDISGNFLNNKIFIKLYSLKKNKNNLILKLPKLDIEARVLFEKNKSNNVNGSFNLEIFNNLLKFNFIKKDNIKLSDGFTRTKLINSSFKGDVSFKPNFYARFNFEPSSLDAKNLFLFIQNFFLSNNTNNLALIKKINGIYNFKSKFEGTIINNNGEVLFKNFRVGRKKSYYFNAKIVEFGKKGKIQFNLVKTLKYKKDQSKKIEITGFLIPSRTKVIFEKFLIEGNNLSAKKIKEHENKFDDDVIQNSLNNVFNESKIDKYFKDIF